MKEWIPTVAPAQPPQTRSPYNSSPHNLPSTTESECPIPSMTTADIMNIVDVVLTVNIIYMYIHILICTYICIYMFINLLLCSFVYFMRVYIYMRVS